MTRFYTFTAWRNPDPGLHVLAVIGVAGPVLGRPTLGLHALVHALDVVFERNVRRELRTTLRPAPRMCPAPVPAPATAPAAVRVYPACPACTSKNNSRFN